jgi:hypothetical protein
MKFIVAATAVISAAVGVVRAEQWGGGGLVVWEDSLRDKARPAPEQAAMSWFGLSLSYRCQDLNGLLDQAFQSSIEVQPDGSLMLDTAQVSGPLGECSYLVWLESEIRAASASGAVCVLVLQGMCAIKSAPRTWTHLCLLCYMLVPAAVWTNASTLQSALCEEGLLHPEPTGRRSTQESQVCQTTGTGAQSQHQA